MKIGEKLGFYDDYMWRVMAVWVTTSKIE